MSVKEENEITVKINCDINKFCTILENKGFNIVEKFSLNDTFFIPSNLEVNKLSTREILKSAVLVRDIHDKITDNFKKKITFKRKEFDEKGSILSQDAVSCNITNIEEAKKLLIAIGYKEIMNIKENDIGFEKDGFKIVTKDIVNGDKLIEVETNVNNKDLDNIDKLKNKLNELEIPIDTSNYFVKKAEIELDKILGR